MKIEFLGAEIWILVQPILLPYKLNESFIGRSKIHISAPKNSIFIKLVAK